MKENSAILIFTKIPVLNQVKTRLEKSVLNSSEILDLHICFVRDTVRQCNRTAADQIFLSIFDPYNSNSPLSFLEEEADIVETEFHRQVGNTFGERMKEAIEWCFSRNVDKLIVLGSDSPQIQPKVLDEAINLLDVYDVVIGPSAMGGIYLIGLNSSVSLELFEQVFDGVELVSFSNYIKKNHLTCKLLEELTDIDIDDDLIGLMAWMEFAISIDDKEISIPKYTHKLIEKLNLSIIIQNNDTRKKRLSKI